MPGGRPDRAGPRAGTAASTGSTALYVIRQAIQGGLIECGMALGFEKMSPGPLGAKAVWTDRESPLGKMMKTMAAQRCVAPLSPRLSAPGHSSDGPTTPRWTAAARLAYPAA